jgi:hypothetical protein
MSKNHYLRSADMKIVLSDSLLTALLVGLSLYAAQVMHPVFCFLLAALAAAGMAVLFFTKVGFWIVTVLYSFAWAIVWALIAGALSNNNVFLQWAVGIIAFVCSIFLHRAARRYHEIISNDETGEPKL